MIPTPSFWLTLANKAAYDAAFPSGQSIATRGTRHRLCGIEAGSAGVLAGTWSAPPAGDTATFADAVVPGTYEIAPRILDSTATTCWPLRLFYRTGDR